jgi:hypothetical protein
VIDERILSIGGIILRGKIAVIGERAAESG